MRCIKPNDIIIDKEKCKELLLIMDEIKKVLIAHSSEDGTVQPSPKLRKIFAVPLSLLRGATQPVCCMMMERPAMYSKSVLKPLPAVILHKESITQPRELGLPPKK